MEVRIQLMVVCIQRLHFNIFYEKWYDNHSPLIYSLNKVTLTALADCVVLNEGTSAFIEVKNSSLPSFLARLRIWWRGFLRHAYIQSSILTLESSSRRHLIFSLTFLKLKIMNSGDVFKFRLITFVRCV